jgi:DNA-binding LacI/PurR family transcriptional regulator
MKVNIKTIAHESGVSTATVSRVLNNYPSIREITRKKVLKVIDKYNYEINAVAKSLKQKKTMTIGVIIGNVLSQFYSIVAKSVEDIALENGFNMILCNGNDDPDKELKYLKLLKSNRVDGIIFTPTGQNSNYILSLIKTDTKVVLLDRLIDNLECDAVLVDNYMGSYNATMHLIDQGYKRIGIINGYINRTTGRERLKGYKYALKDSGIKIDDDLIKIGNFKKSSGYRLTEEILRASPDAIFVTNLDMAIGSILFLREKNVKIPDDIGFISFDDSEWAVFMEPPLTVVQQPTGELAELATEILIKKIKEKNNNKPIIHTLNTRLEIRGSCIKKS